VRVLLHQQHPQRQQLQLQQQPDPLLGRRVVLPPLLPAGRVLLQELQGLQAPAP
jgi:hypothetical protein